MGYGFVEYKTKKSAMNAIKKLQVFVKTTRLIGFCYSTENLMDGFNGQDTFTFATLKWTCSHAQTKKKLVKF